MVDKFTIEIVGHHCVPKVKVLMIAPTLILARRGGFEGEEEVQEEGLKLLTGVRNSKENIIYIFNNAKYITKNNTLLKNCKLFFLIN